MPDETIVPRGPTETICGADGAVRRATTSGAASAIGVRGALLAFAVTLAFTAHPARAAGTPPARVASINLCTDELLVRLGDPSQVATVTWLSAVSAGSNVAAEVIGVPANRGLAEEVVAARPDLVLAGRYTARQAASVLRRIGFRVVEAEAPRTLDGVRAEIRRVAEAIGHPDRGEAMIAELERRLSRPAPVREPKLRAAVLRPNGFTAGPGSLSDELMRRAGLVNVAAELKLDNYGQLPLETILTSGVDLLIVDGERAGPPAMATEILNHPALKRLGDRVRVVAIPPKFWTCYGPEIANAYDALVDAAAGIAR
ncbi:ABC transporter substrate-binding protein [Hansschlegelia plantiphila]|uniref:Cobalamin ABC transporter substrate-binding protein n=1 Tax=Hansschlegelia plantiphila TaxID=374655 RepID=A0A9W6IZ13_9HYPH|nr:ABC transporter substrate-binding protein [Hansschlegelia plantiphila]GLK66786.1 cobalamin ABC transporter substrate-binding protein [Hansschlegelia plantiphila]